MDSSAFNGVGAAIDGAFKLLIGLLILVPILVGVIIYLLVR